eukprot:g249.t1
MCGIACLIQPGRRFPPDLLDAIDRDLFHRGPDSGGMMSQPGAAFVFRRLAIMDPTPGADQPMSDAAGEVTLVFNGEIYNFLDLRAELESAGVRFRTRSDSEVVLQGYRHWGELLFDRLEGMYAIGLLDRRRNLFLAARDPLGIKPLYLACTGDLTAVASEVRPLLRLVGAQADEAALGELLTFGWASGRLSNYRGVERVPGGTLIRVDLTDGSRRETRFCDPLETLTAPRDADEEAAHEAVRRSLRAHLMSDVGYALQLSGGVDSGLVTALTAAETDRPLSTFAVAVDDPALDEAAYRRPLVARYGLDHREHPIDGVAFADALPAAVRAMEGPAPHGGCVTLYALCGEIAASHKVVLTGEGADEMFGGYMRYRIWRKLMLQERLDSLWPRALPMPDLWPFRGARRLRGVDAAAYAALYENLEAMRRLFPDLLPAPPGAREAASARFKDFRDRLFAVDQSAYLESLLVRQDKMSMARSVEARVPFVHMPLLRTVNRLPHCVRCPGGETKPALKRLADRYLDPETVHRRKVGLLLPYDRWAGDPAALGRFLDDLTDPNGRLRALAAPGALDAVVDRFRKGERRGLPRLFALINMEQWLRSVAVEGPRL